MSDHPLLDLAATAEVKQVKSFTATAEGLTGAALAEMYAVEKRAAVDESEGTPTHFSEQSGEIEGDADATLVQFSIALNNTCRESEYRIPIPGDGEASYEVLAYQSLMTALPKSRRKARMRPVHTAPLLGLGEEGRLGVFKLELMPQKSTKGDSPLKLLIDGLALCAAVDGHRESVSAQATKTFEKTVSVETPALIVLANSRYWDLYHKRSAKTAGPWHAQLARLAGEIEESAGVAVSVCGTRLYGDPGWRLRQARPLLETEPVLTNSLILPIAKGKKSRSREADLKEIIEADLDRAPRGYSPREFYDPGDRIEHATLGVGIVQRSVGTNKVQVRFDGEVKVLVQGR